MRLLEMNHIKKSFDGQEVKLPLRPGRRKGPAFFPG